MVSSRAWFALAVAGVLGLFYVGHGLNVGPTGTAAAQEAKAKAEPLKTVVKWELIQRDGPNRVSRIKIPGGWIVESTHFISTNNDGIGVGLTFVPDPEHKWDGNSLP